MLPTRARVEALLRGTALDRCARIRVVWGLGFRAWGLGFGF